MCVGTGSLGRCYFFKYANRVGNKTTELLSFPVWKSENISIPT